MRKHPAVAHARPGRKRRDALRGVRVPPVDPSGKVVPRIVVPALVAPGAPVIAPHAVRRATNVQEHAVRPPVTPAVMTGRARHRAAPDPGVRVGMTVPVVRNVPLAARAAQGPVDPAGMTVQAARSAHAVPAPVARVVTIVLPDRVDPLHAVPVVPTAMSALPVRPVARRPSLGRGRARMSARSRRVIP